MKLNMGCGNNKKPDFVNVDMFEECEPDVLFDLESTPWPWLDDSVDEVLFNHSLEHIGAETKVFLAIIQELYRVCMKDALLRVNVPHPRHDNFITDPTHVRIITPDVLGMFSKANNDHWKRTNAANTPLAHYLGVDFEIENYDIVLEEPYQTACRDGSMSLQQLDVILKERNNIASEYRMLLRVRKA